MSLAPRSSFFPGPEGLSLTAPLSRRGPERRTAGLPPVRQPDRCRGPGGRPGRVRGGARQRGPVHNRLRGVAAERRRHCGEWVPGGFWGLARGISVHLPAPGHDLPRLTERDSSLSRLVRSPAFAAAACQPRRPSAPPSVSPAARVPEQDASLGPDSMPPVPESPEGADGEANGSISSERRKEDGRAWVVCA